MVLLEINLSILLLLVCLLWDCRSTGGFSLICRPHQTGEVLPNLTYARRSWPLSSRFFCVTHLLCHGASVYNGYLRGPVTLTSNSERLAGELSLSVFKT